MAVRVVGDGDRESGDLAGRGLPQRGQERGDARRIVESERSLSGDVDTAPSGECVECGADAAAPGPRPGDQRARHGGADPVLVADGVRVHTVPEGLLVGVDEGFARADQPFEAGEGAPGVGAARAGVVVHESAGDDRARYDGRRIGGCVGQDRLAEKRAGLVAGQHPPIVAVADADRAPVGVGVEGYREVGVHAARGGEQQIGGPGLLRVRKGDGGEVGVGLLLPRHGVHVGKAGAVQRVHDEGAADAVHGGHRDANGCPVGLGEPYGDPVEVVVADAAGAGVGAHRRAGDVVGGGGDRGLDLPVGRPMSCAPPAR